MNKISIHTKIKTETKTKLEILAKKEGLSIGQLIDLMTSKQKCIK